MGSEDGEPSSQGSLVQRVQRALGCHSYWAGTLTLMYSLSPSLYFCFEIASQNRKIAQADLELAAVFYLQPSQQLDSQAWTTRSCFKFHILPIPLCCSCSPINNHWWKLQLCPQLCSWIHLVWFSPTTKLLFCCWRTSINFASLYIFVLSIRDKFKGFHRAEGLN